MVLDQMINYGLLRPHAIKKLNTPSSYADGAEGEVTGKLKEGLCSRLSGATAGWPSPFLQCFLGTHLFGNVDEDTVYLL